MGRDRSLGGRLLPCLLACRYSVETMDDKVNRPLFCGFCGRDQEEVSRLVAGFSANICGECIALCGDIVIHEEARKLAAGPLLDELEARKNAVEKRLLRLEIALTPFAQHPLSTDPEFGRTRLFSLAIHDDQIKLARDALGMEPE